MRRWWIWASLAAAVLAAVAGLFWLPPLLRRVEAPIVVGLVHSATGPLGGAESAMLEAEILALEEINESGGLLGRRLEWRVADGRSEPREFGREARRLVEEEKVAAIVGGLTSASREALMGAIGSADVLLIHAGLFEGMENSMSWFGLGPLPNQQAMPAVSWCVDALGARKFFLAGVRDVSSYAVHAVVRDQLKALGGEAVGEGFVGLDGSGAGELAAAMKASGADVAISTIVGDANAAFLGQFAAAGLTPEKLPIVCLRVSEDDLRRIPPEHAAGHYAAWAYFQSLGGEANRRFVERFRARHGAERTVGDPAASAYYGVKLWARAVEEAGSTRTVELLEHLPRQSVGMRDEVISVDRDMVHAWRPFRVGKIRRDGQIDEVWSLDRSIRPIAYPIFRPGSEWRAALEGWRSIGEREAGSPAPPPGEPPTPARPAAANGPIAR
ncbi:transporter substrate-binding protein [Paludisphaera sp.]|uniref:transporter substrate-binding protein n=1 Tax=Paludisphaera sp. TaxID=2017432 RepID=UPI00301BF116